MEQKRLRKEKMANIRMSLKCNPTLRTTTDHVEKKIEKKQRRTSISYGDVDLMPKDKDDLLSDEEETNSSLFHERYTIGEKAGEGAHGVVKQCEDKNTGSALAVKTLVLEAEDVLLMKKNFTEIRSLSHPNILGYKSLYLEPKNSRCYLVMDLFPYPELENVEIQDEQELKEIFYQLLETIKYLHRNKICHRDIKPENILYNQLSRQIKLIDFGISKKVEERGRKRDMLTLTGTPYYRAPEMFSGGGYDQMVDLWAVGVTLFKLMTGFTPFESEYHSQTIDRILKDEVVFPEKLKFQCSMTLKRFVKDLLCRNKKERPTAEEALQDMWFLDLRPQQSLTKSLTISSQENKENLKSSISFSMSKKKSFELDVSCTDGTHNVKHSNRRKKNGIEVFESIEECQEIFGFE